MLETLVGSSLQNEGALITLTLLAAGCLTSWLLKLAKIKKKAKFDTATYLVIASCLPIYLFEYIKI